MEHARRVHTIVTGRSACLSKVAPYRAGGRESLVRPVRFRDRPAARLARLAGRSVKLIWSREEEFTWAYFRPAGLIEVSSAVADDGLITAWEYHNYNSGPAAINPAYPIPNQLVAFHTTLSPLRQG